MGLIIYTDLKLCIHNSRYSLFQYEIDILWLLVFSNWYQCMHIIILQKIYQKWQPDRYIWHEII